KARTYAGTEHAIVLNAAPAQTLPVGATGTQVSVVRNVGTVAGGETEVLGIDPATFARFAYTDRRVFGADVPALVRRLQPPGRPAAAVRGLAGPVPRQPPAAAGDLDLRLPAGAGRAHRPDRDGRAVPVPGRPAALDPGRVRAAAPDRADPAGPPGLAGRRAG